MSNAYLDVAPPLPQLWPHVVDLDSSDDEAPPVALDILSTSFAPPPPPPPPPASNSKIVDAIAALFTHTNVIHTDLVEHIGQVHEHIMERQEHDIVAIHDTLSALCDDILSSSPK